MCMRVLQLITLDKIIETEEHDKKTLAELVTKIESEGSWTVPVILEYSTQAIMDGHHRYNAAKKIGLSRIPCILMDYDKSGVVLRSWREDYDINVNNIFEMINKSKKYPIKTTRHLFDPPVSELNIPLSLLY